MDDDEDFPPEYFEQSLAHRKKQETLIKKDIIITPTLMYRHSGHIQNQ